MESDSNSTKPRFKRYKNIISVNAFVIGAVIMALEMTGSRFLTPFFGNSVFTWASIISMVLLSLAVGYFTGGYLAEKKPDTKVISLFVLGSGFLILFIPLYYESLFINLYDLINSNKTGSFLGAVLTLFLPLLILGMYSPFSVKLMSKFSDKPGKVAGNLYAVSTIGSIVGTIGVTFFLIPYIGSKSITISLSFITFLSALSLYFLESKYLEKKKNLLSMFFFIMYLLVFCLVIFNKHPQKTSKYLLEKAESEYNTITVKQKGEYISMSFRRHMSGHIESRINVLNDKELPLSYSQLMQAGLFYKTDPRNILMVGLGGGTISNYIVDYYKDIKIDGIELDKEVIRLAKKYFKLKENENINIVNQDGRIFLYDSGKLYDIIMLDAYKGGFIPFHLCTDEYFKLVKRHLNPEGVVVLNLHSGSKLYKRILSTLNNNFKFIDLYLSKSRGNIVAVVHNSSKYTKEVLKFNADSLQNKYHFYHSLTDVYNHISEVELDKKSRILTDDFAPVNFLNAVTEHNLK